MWNPTLRWNDYHWSYTYHSLIITLRLATIKIAYCPFKWKEIRRRATDSCYPRGTDCCCAWRTRPCLCQLPIRGSYSLPPPSSPGVIVNLHDCSRSRIWAVPAGNPSPSPWTSTPDRFAFGLDRVFALFLLPAPDGLREADKKGNGLRSKGKKKNGRVSSNSWVRLGESQPVFQACCVLTHHCQDCDLWFLGLHPSCW